ncbi:MAG TPA: AMP-binding protein, partial [Streptosporangiaceae bacterium]|nr:AMP-binding protein [Streptosporangiaceae bacterium]
MALNIADLFEHAADAFGDRIAVACGDRQVTYRELDHRTNQLAHHLASLGVGSGDHVGMYARNSLEAIETLIATYKLRARTVNINYRYVESELRYMFTDADLVALVYDREFAPLVSIVLPDSPGVHGAVVIGDGDETVPGVPYDEALAAQSGERDFGERSGDDIYLLYTGGTTGYPKGVLWRQEDVWRTLGGGIDFLTGERLADEWVQSRNGAASPGMSKLCSAPLIHGSAQWTTLMSFFTGDTVVLLAGFDPHEIWRAVQKHKVNVIVVVGDAMARPLIEAFSAGEYDASSVLSFSSNGSLFS